MLADLLARGLRQGERDLMQIAQRLGLVAHRGLRVLIVFPHGNDDKGEQHRIEHADDGEFESGHFVVEAEIVGAATGAGGKHEADGIELGDGNDHDRQDPRGNLVQDLNQVNHAAAPPRRTEARSPLAEGSPTLSSRAGGSPLPHVEMNG